MIKVQHATGLGPNRTYLKMRSSRSCCWRCKDWDGRRRKRFRPGAAATGWGWTQRRATGVAGVAGFDLTNAEKDKVLEVLIGVDLNVDEASRGAAVAESNPHAEDTAAVVLEGNPAVRHLVDSEIGYGLVFNPVTFR